MALTNNVSFANRYGLNVKIYKYPKSGEGDAAVTVDFANECSLEVTGDITWATGGQTASKLIGFHNPMEGTFRISTQLMTTQLLELISGNDVSGADEAVSEISFKNTYDSIYYYVIVADTVWQDKTGASYAETITLHKALPKRAYNITYNGEGDPTSLDIEFELLEDGDTKDIVTITKA